MVNEEFDRYAATLSRDMSVIKNKLEREHRKQQIEQSKIKQISLSNVSDTEQYVKEFKEHI